MAPVAGGKRKRSDRQPWQDEEASRPSPHRPEGLNLAQQNQHQSIRGGRGGAGFRSQNRGGQGNNANSPLSGTYNSQPAQRAPQSAESSPLPNTPQRANLASDRPSRPASPMERIATLAQEKLVERAATSAPAALHAYEYVTEEILASWQESGKQQLLEMHKQEGGGARVTNAVIQELVKAGLDQKLNPAEAGSAIRQMIADQQSVDVQSAFLDAISLLDGADTKKGALLTLVVATDISAEVIRAELDVPLLQELSLVRTTFSHIRIRKTTNLLYRQANFNLLREETEGYSKLITEYFNTASVATDGAAEGAEEAFQRIKALIGAFDLDVGRVLDVTLDVFANMLVGKFRFFVKLLRASSWWPDGDVLDDVKWEDQGFGTLPPWAEPGSGKWGSSSNEREHQLQLRQARDRAFWPRVREKGLSAFFELGARQIIDFDSVKHIFDVEAQPELDSKGKEQNADRRKRINEARKIMKETHCLPPQGNPDAAQLLGFKLRYYASPARDAQDVWHDNVIHLAAFLIKLGFISLRDLYPHLWPLDGEMGELRERLEKEKDERDRLNRPGLGGNALTMASALPDDMPSAPGPRGLRNEYGSKAGTPKPEGTPRSTAEIEEKEALPRPADQKVLLLKGLLLHGMLPEALHILGRFPWMMDVVDGLPAHFHRILHHMLSKLADEMRPLVDRKGLQDQQMQLADIHASPNAALQLVSAPPRKVLRWAQLDRCNQGDGQEYKFFWDDWADNVPICQSVEDVFLLCNTLLNLSGVKIGQDPGLLIKFVLIGKKSLLEDPSDSNRARWLDLLKRILVPALSLTKQHPVAQFEVWEMLKQFPIATRYNVYAEWYSGKTSRTPDMRSAFALTRLQTREVMMRVTNENAKKQGRALGKVTLSSPGVVIQMILRQLESMNNMISALSECARYFSAMTYDILIWSILNSLSAQGRDRIQADGILTSAWLKAVSRFAALLFTRYTHISPTPVLQYVAAELRECDSTDLEVLEQIVSEMAGIKSEMDYNDAQTLAMAGGELLQAHTVRQLSDTRHVRRPSAKRLLKALAEPQLISQILICLAQEWQMYPNRETAKDMPLKVLGSNMDKVQNVFTQYLEFLRTNLSAAEFADSVPDVATLVGDFGIKPSTALTIWRANIAYYIAQAEATGRKRRLSGEESGVVGDERPDKKQKLNSGDASVSSDAVMQQTATKKGSAEEEAKVPPSTATTEAHNASILAEGVQAPLTSEPSSPLKSNGVSEPWHPVLKPLIGSLSTVAEDLRSKVSLPFFTTFWTLAQHDIFAPALSYEAEIQKLKQTMGEINVKTVNLTAQETKIRARKTKECMDMQDKLKDEMKGQVRSHRQVRDRMTAENSHWFAPFAPGESKEPRHIALLQECFLPRAMLSSLDAHYCVSMLFKIMHANGTPGFSTMMLLEKLLLKQQLATILYQCTTKEAENFGRFLTDVLKTLQRWHADKAAYDKEALGSTRQLPGFARKMSENGTPETVLEYEDFRRLLFKWHGNLNAALKICMESGEYMHIRNGIVVLKAVYQVFPAVNFMGKAMQDQITKLSKGEKRQDLKLAATSLIVDLRRKEKDWVLPQAFRLTEPTKDTQKPASRAASTRPETPQSGSDEKKPALNATVPEFKPSPTPHANGIGRKPSLAGKGDAEDGEIEDEKSTEVKRSDPVANETPAAEAQAKTVVDIRPPAKAPLQTDAISKLPTRPPTPSSTHIPAKVDPVTSTLVPTATQPPPPANGPARSEANRLPSAQTSNRTPHTLPNRPDGAPSRPLPSLPTQHPSGRYSDSRDGYDGYGRLDRPGDMRPPSSREHSPGSRSRVRTPDHGYHSDRERRDGPPNRSHMEDRPLLRPAQYDSRSSRPDPHEQRPLPSVHNRAQGNDRARPNGASSMPPPASEGVPSDRARLVGVDRPAPNSRPTNVPNSSGQPSAPPAQPEPPAGFNAQRFASSNGDVLSRDQQRGAQSSENLSSRPEPPRRQNERPSNDYPQRYDSSRNSRGPPFPEQAPPADRRDQPADHAPTGPRNGRSVPTPSRELFENGNQPRNVPDPSRGRLSRESGVQPPESSYGRLNAPPEVPPGSQQVQNRPAGNGSWNYTAPGIMNNSNNNQPHFQSPSTNWPPESPASFRHGPQRQQLSREMRPPAQGERQGPPSSAQPPSAAEPPVAGMHPSRAAQFGATLPPIQTNIAPSVPSRTAASPTSAPPAGPRGRGGGGPPVGTPTGPSPSNNGAPPGPGIAAPGRKGDRRFAGINIALQNANSPPTASSSQGVNFRGASSRQASLNMSSPAVTQPPPQITASPLEPPPRRDVGLRQEGPSSRPDSRADLFQNRPTPAEKSDDSDARRRRHDDRPDRHRSSQESSHDRHQERRMEEQRGPFRPPPSGMDGSRDGRGGPPRIEDYREGPPRDHGRSSRNDDAGLARPPPTQHNPFHGPPMNFDPRDNNRRPRDDGGDSSRSGGARGRVDGGGIDDYRGDRRGGEEMRDGGRPPRDDGRDNRKRRHDEGPDSDAKRRRSGPGR